MQRLDQLDHLHARFFAFVNLLLRQFFNGRDYKMHLVLELHNVVIGFCLVVSLGTKVVVSALPGLVLRLLRLELGLELLYLLSVHDDLRLKLCFSLLLLVQNLRLHGGASLAFL